MGEGFLLGLSTGTFCAAHCLPVALPFIFSEDIRNAGQNARLVGLFLLGRFIAYLLAGFLLGMVGGYTMHYLDPMIQRRATALVYCLLGLIMLFSGLMYNFPKLQFCNIYKKIYRPGRGAMVYGFLTGISPCPPFIAAASRVLEKGGIWSGVLYFMLFFVGTSIYFLPLLGAWFFQKHMDSIRIIARLTMIFLGAYFLVFLGILGL
ncbi:sulfite exporter TauE/SafE family protein [bacterium]|nr:sulfite exporter TauE/SafE family protein [bacterium]